MARSLDDLTPRQQWLVAGLLCFALVAVYYMQFWRAQSAEIRTLVQQIAQTRAEVDKMRELEEALPELQAGVATLQKRLEVLQHILPQEYETANLLRGVGTLAAQSNLRIRDLEFKQPVPTEFYAESPISLEVTGSYHDLGRFFDRIGKFARIINIDDVDITALDDSAAGTVRAQITAKTFIFLQEPAPEEGDGEVAS